MKSYKEFINESYYTDFELPEFKFAIDMRNSTNKDKSDILKELEKYFDLDLMNSDSPISPLFDRNPCAWVFEIRKGWTKDSKELICDYVTTPGWGAGWDYMTNIIIPEEFLSVGLKGVKEYIEIKSNVNKYNL